jgi:hypothetical protein
MKKSLGLLGFVLIFAIQANSASARYCYNTNGEQRCIVTSDSSGYTAPQHSKAYLAAQIHRSIEGTRRRARQWNTYDRTVPY